MAALSFIRPLFLVGGTGQVWMTKKLCEDFIYMAKYGFRG